MKVSDAIRRIIEKTGESRYAISKATGIDQATLSKFMAGERGLSMKALDRLAEYLNLQIVVKPKRKGR